jgi:hypothetical protein
VSAPAPPIVLRWTPEPADLQESVATGRWARGGAARHKVAITAGVMVLAALACVAVGAPAVRLSLGLTAAVLSATALIQAGGAAAARLRARTARAAPATAAAGRGRPSSRRT